MFNLESLFGFFKSFNLIDNKGIRSGSVNVEEKMDEQEEEFVERISRGSAPEDYERQLLNTSDRTIGALKGELVPPYELEIQPSSTCNLRCAHCFGKNYVHLENRLNSENAFERIVQQVQGFRVNGLEIEVAKFCGTTGDPLVNEHTAYAIRRFKEIGKKVFLFTNGTLLDRKLKDGNNFIDYVLLADRVNVSLDAGSEEVFQETKGVKGFERAISNLEELSQKKVNYGKKLNIVVSYVVTPGNYKDVLRAVERVKASGSDEMRFRVDFTDKEGIGKIADEVEKMVGLARMFEDSVFKVVPIYSGKEIQGRNGVDIFSAEGRKCYTHHFWACVGPNGEVFPCGHRTYAGAKSYGNILDQSLQEIWFSAQRKEVSDNLPDEHCDYCSPSSLRRNVFLTEISKFGLDKACSLCHKYALCVGKQLN